ncbi:MAG: 4-hydroxybenzoate octaprenyltransferase [Selenomonadaceae bacterium]|nr:4-hydroxybenzoate octaprenyltransferase [Selenomonadaceae bacterium]
MTEIIRLLRAHIQNVAIHHTIFDLPFAFTGALMASGGHPGWLTLLWVAMALTGARCAALALDNLVDFKYDKVHPRFTRRPMVTGALTKRDAVIFIALCALVMLYSVMQLPDICLKLLPIAALPSVIYPFMKRITCWCHAVLGVAIAMAPAGGWMAAGGSIDFDLILLCSAVGLWIGSFDVIYGAQDIEFDISQGLHSMAVSVGAVNAFRLAAIGHLMSILTFCWLGVRLNLNYWYFIGIAVAACTLVYQHYITDERDFSWLTQVYFMRNGIVAAAMLIFTYANYL